MFINRSKISRGRWSKVETIDCPKWPMVENGRWDTIADNDFISTSATLAHPSAILNSKSDTLESEVSTALEKLTIMSRKRDRVNSKLIKLTSWYELRYGLNSFDCSWNEKLTCGIPFPNCASGGVSQDEVISIITRFLNVYGHWMAKNGSKSAFITRKFGQKHIFLDSLWMLFLNDA